MTLSEIKKDLREIRQYYMMPSVFDDTAKTETPHAVLGKVKLYKETLLNAPPKLYIIYVLLYEQNNTQAALAEEWGYSPEYVYKMNMALCEYLQKNLNA